MMNLVTYVRSQNFLISKDTDTDRRVHILEPFVYVVLCCHDKQKKHDKSFVFSPELLFHILKIPKNLEFSVIEDKIKTENIQLTFIICLLYSFFTLID